MRKSNFRSVEFNFLRRTSIKLRLMGTFLILSLLPLILIGYSAYSISSSALSNNIGAYSEAIVSQISKNLKTELDNYSRLIDDISNTDFVQSKLYVYNSLRGSEQMIFLEDLEALIDRKTALVPGLVGYYFYNEAAFIGNGITYDFHVESEGIMDGSVLAAFVEAKGLDSEMGSWYIDTQGCLLYIKNIYSDIDMTYLATIIIQVEPRVFLDLFIGTELGEEVELLTVTAEGINVFSDKEAYQPGGEFPYPTILEEMQNNVSASINTRTDEPMKIAYNAVQSTDWSIMALIPISLLNSSADMIRNWLLIIGFLCIVFSVLSARFISRSILLPLDKLMTMMDKGRSGDFSLLHTDGGSDEIHSLFMDYTDMIYNVKGLIKRVQDTGNEVLKFSDDMKVFSKDAYEASEQISATLHETAIGAGEQAKDIVESVEQMNQLSEGIKNVQIEFQKVKHVIEDTQKISNKALDIVEILSDKADRTNKASERIFIDISSLNEDMKSIGNIVAAIKAVSEQTNLLALNAAIEAARAGEAGKGFGVVADEVKMLANQSKDASLMITEKIGAIKTKIDRTMEEVSIAGQSLSEQMTSVKQTDDSYRTISSSMNAIIHYINSVDASIERITEVKEKTMAFMENISSISEETAATAQEVAATTAQQTQASHHMMNLAQQMNGMSRELEKAASQFYIED